jgi:hypothetical protein
VFHQETSEPSRAFSTRSHLRAFGRRSTSPWHTRRAECALARAKRERCCRTVAFDHGVPASDDDVRRVAGYRDAWHDEAASSDGSGNTDFTTVFYDDDTLPFHSIEVPGQQFAIWCPPSGDVPRSACRIPATEARRAPRPAQRQCRGTRLRLPTRQTGANRMTYFECASSRRSSSNFAGNIASRSSRALRHLACPRHDGKAKV